MESVWRDFRYGLRMLARNKGFTAVAVFALALGIGPNVAMFSIIYATFLAPMPYPDANQLVVVWSMVKGQRGMTRAEDFAQYRAQSKTLQCFDFSSYNILHLTNPDHTESEVSGLPVTTGDCLAMRTEKMALGRYFYPDEGVPGKDHLVILTNMTWREQFHSDPNIIGTSIRIADQPYTVVGVSPPGAGDRTGVAFYVPLVLTPGVPVPGWGGMFGRLKAGATVQQAQSELSLINQRLVAAKGPEAVKEDWTISVEPLRNDWMNKKLQRNLWLLLAAVGFVLLISCANLANLLLARGSSRQQELAVRSAMGATRRQVFTQLLTESLTLAISGGLIGIALGWALMKLIMSIQTELAKESAEAVVQMNIPVLYFAVGVSLLAGIVSGCAPAFQAAQLNLSEVLKQGSRSVTGRGRMKTQRLLVMGEFALAITLLAGAGMALHSFMNLTSLDLGFRSDHILTGTLQAPRKTRPLPEKMVVDFRRLMNKVASLPGVRSVAVATNVPLHGNDSLPFSVEGYPVADADRPVADYESVTPSYFDTFGVRLKQGRLFAESDVKGAPQVIMVSQSFVDRFLPGVNPLDQRLMLPTFGPNQLGPPTAWQIVGVFQDVRNGEHLNDKTAPEMFVPFWQSPFPWAALAVRTTLKPELISKTVHDTVAQTLQGYSLVDIGSMDQTLDTQLTGDRFGTVLFGGFAALALVLAALGIYGVMAFAVAQRNHEIGLRMALGAQRRDVVLLILKDGLKLAGIGLGTGLLGVAVMGRLMHSTLYGVPTIDLASLAVVTATLLSVAILACYLPARRSAKVDPMIALRQD